ncbi:intracellular multiplication protein IcmV [Legionella gratiana]|uniref:Intracellular multiplication protein IcmV n=1 Tax=Legionella gratiana TaxID=45066 RepID=A0A378JAK1_9GAMM|nr:type IVB secretion system protein IcmV [Legionella gratiana]KTD14650.1 intracellular multiplication protein IcmV [Legionella gratiana]STX41610.1 intracellular multiplication protein IcmV [Legionella gratiana]
MKKHHHSRIVTLFSRIFKIRSWFDWERMKAITVSLGNGIKHLFVPHQNIETEESFTDATKKFGLSDERLLAQQKALFRLSMLMMLAAVLILCYAGYQLYLGSLKAFFVSLVVMSIALVLAFRYHFWYFQIKQRKLGCTFSEWYRQGLLGEKK